MAQLNGLVNNSKIQNAIQARELMKILGIPPSQTGDEELLAGGNITINPPVVHAAAPVPKNSSLLPWIAFFTLLSVMLSFVFGGLIGWLVLTYNRTPTTQGRPPIQQSGSETIEFFKP